MATYTRLVKITDDDVEILIEKKENENTRKNPENYAEHSSANMKQVVSLEMESIQRSHKSLRLFRFRRRSDTSEMVEHTDLNYWIKLLSCIIKANGGHIGLSHINLHWYY